MVSPALNGAHSFPILRSSEESALFPPLGPNVKVLMVWPRFPPSFWGFEGVLKMIPEEAMSPPLGLITVEARPGCLFLSTFHTFPDEYAVVKTQSLIEKK